MCVNIPEMRLAHLSCTLGLQPANSDSLFALSILMSQTIS